jgi:hypothetical protein
MRVDFRRKLTLTGELVTLRPGGGSDAALLAGLLNDREVLCLTGAVHSSNERGNPLDAPAVRGDL